VKPDSLKAIADGVLEFAEMNEETRKEMGQRGRKYVLENHSIRYLAGKYVELFEG
jgi:glycosyltransferase involved in cell wall biosynthesis